MEADIRNQPLLDSLFSQKEITHVVHLAAQPWVRHSMTHPQTYVDSNLDGFVQLLEVLRRHPKTKLVYASSSSVYGLNQKIPFSEIDPTDRPLVFMELRKNPMN